MRAAWYVCGVAAFGGVFAAAASEGGGAAVSASLPAFDSFAAEASAPAVANGGFHSFARVAQASEDALARFDSSEPRGLYITIR